MHDHLTYQPTAFKNHVNQRIYCGLLGVIGGTWLIYFGLKNTYTFQQLILLTLFVWVLALINLTQVLWSQYNLAQADYQVASINQQQTGIWVQSNARKIFIAATWLTINENDKKVTLQFSHALRFDSHGQPHLLAGGQITWSRRFFTSTQLAEFVAAIRTIQAGHPVAVSKQSRLQPLPPIKPIKKRIWFVTIGALLGSLLFIMPQTSHTSQKKVAQQNARYTKVDYQPGQTTRTDSMKFKINHAYRAKNDAGQALLILNRQVTPIKSSADDATDIMESGFEVYKKWSLSAKNNDDYFDSGAQSYPTILINNQSKPVLNTLASNIYLNEIPTESITLNVVLNLPTQKQFDFFFDEADLVVHFKQTDLEVIK
ncbi:hypothetical protein [Loigolactobacillus zhaoyuanensis]|uniref:hypothetical protein n=1 Tax=Loigolactobacillus zhaoyuanensis TaxID=2486017 RepID=UPI000F743283|nr:hypothetical protein [Loigolactobacillus zhaoyuanensis]